jgi:alpha-2-macroglobulin
MVVLILNLLLAATLVGGRAVLPMLATPATLRAAEPADGSQQVPVRARVVLHFDRPMNPRSVEAAFQLAPSLLIWDPSFTTLTISPTLSLRPATDYRLTIGATALERNLRPLAAPLSLVFRTVAAPAVRSTIPAEGSTEILPIAPIVINFSRPMVPPTSVLSITDFPALRFEPPIVGHARWLDQSTLLFQIDTPLAPATEYRATIAGDLADLGGGPLGEPYSWTFRVAAPKVLAAIPSDSARDVALRAPLVMTLTQALPTTQLRQALQFSPTVAGQLQSTVLPNQTQLVTFTPSIGWQPATEYQATLQLSSASPASWRFRTAPRLALTGRFPGEAQILPLNQPIRLIFSTAVEPELLRAALRFNPPIEQLQISGSGSELQITAALRAATPYTVTIAPDLTDRNGTTLGITAMMRFQTAPAPPMLTLPEITGRLAQFLPDQPIELLVRRTNLSALNLELFDMDEATVVRTRVFSDSDWQRFEPERYQRPLRHSWNVPLNDTLNGAVEDPRCKRCCITTRTVLFAHS